MNQCLCGTLRGTVKERDGFSLGSQRELMFFGRVFTHTLLVKTVKASILSLGDDLDAEFEREMHFKP